MDDLLYGALDIPEIDRTKALLEVKELSFVKVLVLGFFLGLLQCCLL